MNYSKLLLVAAVMTGLAAAGCGGKKRIEGMEIPTQPQSNDVAIPGQATEPPPAPTTAEPPPAPPEPQVEAAAPTPEPTQAPEPPPPPAPKAEKELEKYIVVKGDTLWGIAGMSIIYKDNFEWPLLFKQNRDQIKDPDLIYPKQEFLLRRDWTQEDLDKAHKDANDTPKYVPHTKPREALPVNYF